MAKLTTTKKKATAPKVVLPTVAVTAPKRNPIANLKHYAHPPKSKAAKVAPKAPLVPVGPPAAMPKAPVKMTGLAMDMPKPAMPYPGVPNLIRGKKK
jgi:hypothetical protein